MSGFGGVWEDRSLSLALGLLVVGEAVAASVLMAEISSASTSTNMQTSCKDPQSLTRGPTPSGLMCGGIGWSLACSGSGVVEGGRKVYRKDVLSSFAAREPVLHPKAWA